MFNRGFFELNGDDNEFESMFVGSEPYNLFDYFDQVQRTHTPADPFLLTSQLLSVDQPSSADLLNLLPIPGSHSMPTANFTAELPLSTGVKDKNNTLVYADASEISPIPTDAKIMMDSDEREYHAGRQVVTLDAYCAMKKAMENTMKHNPSPCPRNKYNIGGKQITLDSLRRRNYAYVETGIILTLDDKQRCDFNNASPDGKLYLDGKEIVWLTKRNNYPTHMIEGKKITLDALLKRNYIFVDDGTSLTRAEKKRCDFSNEGVHGELYVDGREIIWQSKSNKRNYSVIDSIEYNHDIKPILPSSYKNTYQGLTLFSGDPTPGDRVDLTTQQAMVPPQKKPRLDDDVLRHVGPMNTRKL